MYKQYDVLMEKKQYGKVYFLCRCTKREYAEDMFYKGNLYFNNPIEWIKQASCGNVGQGDLFEGVYSSVVTDGTLCLRTDPETFDYKGKKYLRSHSIVNSWLCLCFYSIDEMSKGKVDKGTCVYNMTKEYIESFSQGETFESMQGKPLKDRMSMVIIPQTGKFFRHIRRFFYENGMVEEEDFFISKVTYRSSHKDFVIYKVPDELFSKDVRFEQQNEVRILLNPNSQKVQRILIDGHKICVGPMDEFAQLKTNFYSGATVRVGEHQLHIESAPTTNMIGPMNEWNLEPLLGFMKYAYHTTTCKLNGELVNSYEFWVELVKIFAWKYNIEIQHEVFVDGIDDHVILIFHGDDLNTILNNERKDSYFYSRVDNSYRAPTFDAIYGGDPAGLVKISYRIKKKTDNRNA